MIEQGAEHVLARWRAAGLDVGSVDLVGPVLEVAHVGGPSAVGRFLDGHGDAIRADPVLHHVLVWALTWRRRWAEAAAEAGLAGYDVGELPAEWTADRRFLAAVGGLLPRPPEPARAERRLDVHLRHDGPVVTCRARVGDHEFLAAVDTGASTSVLTPRLCRAIGAPTDRTASRTVHDGAGRTLTTWPVVVPALALGEPDVDVDVHGVVVVAVVLDLPEALGVDMILSPCDLGPVVTVDLERSALRVGPGAGRGKTVSGELWWVGGLPATPVAVEGRPSLFGLDTGAVMTVVDGGLVAHRADDRQVRTATVAGDLTVRLARQVRIDLGPSSSAGPVLARPMGRDPLAVGLEADGLLGADRIAAVILDTVAARVGLALRAVAGDADAT